MLPCRPICCLHLSTLSRLTWRWAHLQAHASVQRRARVGAEAGEPRRPSLIHDDARSASRVGDDVEAGDLHGTCSAKGRACGGVQVGKPQRQPLVHDDARLASHFQGAALGRWAYQARRARCSATGPTGHGVLLPSPSHAATASQSHCEADASLSYRAANVSLPRRAAATAGPPPPSAAGPLPLVDSTHRRASILPSSSK
jgi:hypothetical protein